MTWRTAGALLVTVILAAGCQDDASSSHPLEQSIDTEPSTASGSPSAADVTAHRGAWTIDDPRVTESSGLARSERYPGVYYTHNDRGGLPQLFAVSPTGTRAVLTLDVTALDWEDVATTPDRRIWVGDIGDNDRVRDSIEIAVVDEPDVLVSADVPATTYTFGYPDGPHDAEALLVDPRDGRVYIVTKDGEAGRVYRGPKQLDDEGRNKLKLVGDAPHNVTGGAFAPDGSAVVLRNQGRAYFYSELGGEATELKLPKQPQGESVTFTPDGTRVLVGSEGAGSKVLPVDAPEIVD